MAETIEQCRERCRQLHPLGPKDKEYVRCLAECEKNKEETLPAAGSPCKGEGHLGKNVPAEGAQGWILATPCEAGFNAVKATDGKWWCCKVKEEEEEQPKPEDPCPGKGYWLGKDESTCKEGFKPFYEGTSQQTKCCPEKEEPGTEGCPKGNYYAAKGPGDCVAGYVWVKRAGKGWEDYEEGMGGRCECSAWCEQHGYEADCKTKKGETDGGETWEPSGDLQAIIQRLLDRMNELFDYETGLRDEEYNMLLNRLRTNVKAGERGRMESLEDRLGSMGLLGTGMELEEYGKEERKTRQLLADVESQVALDEALRRYDQFLGTTGAAQSLFGTVLGVEQLEEVLNAARRGEGREDMSMLLTLLATLMGGQANDPFWQAILNSASTRQSSQGSDYSWINWLPWLLG